MNSFYHLTIVALIFALNVQQVLNAPVDLDDGNSTNGETVTTTTQLPKLASEKPRDDNTSTELPEFTSERNTSTFTCQGRITGYYADVKLGCRVYHFCTPMEELAGTSYQRMSYICLDNSLFDQKDLNCVKEEDLKIPCDQAEASYDSSNRQLNTKDERTPSMSESLTAGFMMNPITRFIAG